LQSKNKMSLQTNLTAAIQNLFKLFTMKEIDKIDFQATRKEFEGEVTVVLFPLLKITKSNPNELGVKIGNFLTEHIKEVESYNIVSGF